MNPGQYKTQLDLAWNILSALDLARSRNWSWNQSTRPASEFRTKSYGEIWNLCFAEQYYDFILEDYALIQYRVSSFKPLRVSFSYLECPYKAPTYADFLEHDLNMSFAEAGDNFREEYELELLSSPPKSTVTPIRYDYDPDSYTEGLHPASHIHLGHESNIRIGTHKILFPVSFTLFIIRQCYGQDWISLLRMTDAPDWCRYVRDHLNRVDRKHLNPLDNWEMMLN